MIGRKLDAQSYTVLLLVVVGVLLSFNLYAQLNQRATTGTEIDRQFSRTDTGEATRAVAQATQAVADSNLQIASAIQELARAVADLEMVVNVGEGAEGTTTRSGGAAAETAEGARPTGPTTVQGRFELN